MSEIVNKVDKSVLETVDLESFLPKVVWKGLDIATFLEDGFILREKNFRSSLEEFDFSSFADSYVYLHCSTDAIFPEWVYLLLSKNLLSFTNKVYIGSEKNAKNQLLTETLTEIDYTQYRDKPLIIKGCNNGIASPENLLYFFQRTLPYARSIMYGEACSAVPLYKRPKAK